MTSTLNRRQFAGLTLLALAPAAGAADSGFPSKPIRLVVPYPPGGNADNIARVFAKKFADVLGTPVLVDNRPGASGVIGADAVAKANNDGYTLLLTVTSQLTNAGFGVRPTYNATEDFTPIVGLCITPLVFAVPADLPATSLKALEALAQTRQLAYGSYGAGTSTHVMQHLLGQQMRAKDLVHVAYKGENPMVTDMLGGQIQMGLVSVGVAAQMEKAGKLRALAVVGPQRSEFLPRVPTFQEQGYRRLDWTYGVAVYGQSRLPAEVLAKLQKAGQSVMASADVRKAYRAQSNQPWIDSDPQELKKRLVIDSVLWNKVLTQLGPIA